METIDELTAFLATATVDGVGWVDVAELRRAGTPLSVEIPAPVNATIRRESRIAARRASRSVWPCRPIAA